MRAELQGDDPIAIWQRWFTDASDAEPNDPNAAALATASADGVPSVRMVLMKEASEAGFTFFTNAESQKGRELAANPRAALCFHWKSLRRQVRVIGRVSHLDDKATDSYFHHRSRASQIAAAASHQSRPLRGREELEAQVAALTERYDGQEVPRPEYWQGYLLTPGSIEFWMDGPDRLHDRRLFVHEGAGWTSMVLAP